MTNGTRMTRVALGAMAVLALAFAAPAAAGEMKHGDMPGMKMEGSAEGHGMMKMGDKIFGGKLGPWTAEARLMDMKAHMDKAKASGMKIPEAAMANTHHIMVRLTDQKSKKAVTEGKGGVTVTGPDGKVARSGFVQMEDHFGTDVSLPKPGKYTFKAEIESGDKKGAATFTYTLK